MHYHPDMTRQATRDRYAELLEEARLERLAAIAQARPDRERFAALRGLLGGLRIRLSRRNQTAARRARLSAS